VVPDGCIDLLWTGSALLVAGPDTGPVIEAVSPNATIVGIRFHPGAAMRCLNVPAAEIANRRLPLAELWGRRAQQLAEQLLEAATPDAAAAMLERSLSTGMRYDGDSDRAGRDLRRALQGRLSTHETHVRDLVAGLGASERTIRRRCIELFGYGPKTFVRIIRFQRFIARVRRGDRLPLSVLATLCGYADQAHLSREVRRLSGLTPAAVVAQLAPSP
jgi:AraC-like DNA-binding protein